MGNGRVARTAAEAAPTPSRPAEGRPVGAASAAVFRPRQSDGAKPFRLIGLAWLNSTLDVSTLRGYFFAQSIQVVTPGRASSRPGAIGWPQMLQSFLACVRSSLITASVSAGGRTGGKSPAA